MNRRGWIISLVLAGCAAALAFALLRPEATGVASTPIATAQAPARQCVSHPPATLRSLREGRQQLVVVVKAFQPPKGAGGGLVAWLAGAGGKRTELTRFAVHPLRAFTVQEPERSQRFQVSLTEFGHLLQDGQPLCLEVGFDTAAGKPEGGMAEVAIEVVNPPGK